MRKHTVAIMYGFAEGSWHGRKLREALRAAGLQPIRNIQSADIIIGHSAGCYLIPKNTEAKLILHSGYTYWPGRTLLDSLSENLRLERQKHGFFKWFVRCVVNDIYMLKLVQAARMLRGWHDPGQYLDNLSTANHVFVRSQHDPYCEPQKLMSRTNYQHTYVSSYGNHNDLWDNPQYYVNLLQSVL